MKQEEKEAKLKDLKARFYDLLAAKEQAERELQAVNQEIAKVANTPVDDDAPNNP